MKNFLKFFLETEKLKTMPRTGWVLRDVEDPETIAEHTFRLVIISWFLAEKRNFNVKRAILIALLHDLCEVYAGDITPFLYHPNLPEDKEKRKKILMKWARLSRKEKKKIGKVKFKKEKDGLLELIRFLRPNLRNKILSLWLEYGDPTSKEGKFVEQLNRMETLIQSIEFFGTKDIKTKVNWWEWTEEIVDDPLLLKFLKVIQKKFYGRVADECKRQKGLENISDFLLEIGKLKQMPRTIWVSLGVKDPETVASHIFTVTLMTWILGLENEKLDLKRLLKMALCHELSAAYSGDLITPYGKTIPKNKRERIKIFQKLPRLSKNKKRQKFLKDYKEEKRALEKLTLKLKLSLRKEIIQLWEEYKTNRTPEARFLNQINVLAVLLQALQYRKEDKNLPIDFLWEWALEKCENQMCFGFFDALKEKFYKNI